MLVFLHNDLDAIGCEMCIDEMPFKVNKKFYTNYSDFEEKVDEIINYSFATRDDELLIADLSFAERPDTLQKLTTHFKSVLHIDHHQYPDEFFERIIGKNYKHKIDINRCAAKICYDLFGLNNENLKVLCSIIDSYDRWVVNSPYFKKGQQLNKYFWNVEWDHFKEFKNGVPEDYTKVVSEIEETEKREIAELKEKGFIVRAKSGPKITFVFGWKHFNPILISEMEEGQDFVIGVYKNIYKVRIKAGVLNHEQCRELQMLLTGNVTGHDNAFTFVTTEKMELECQIIAEAINTVSKKI
jgi:hypothetical protein